MFARLSIYENVDLALADQFTRWAEATETDPFRELPGYRGSMKLVDRENARLVGIGVYASAGHAQEAETLLTAILPGRPRSDSPAPSNPRWTCDPGASGSTRSSTATEAIMCRWCSTRISWPSRRSNQAAAATPVPNTQRGASMPRVRDTLVTVVAAALLVPVPAVATAKGGHAKGAGKSRQVERVRQTEQKRLKALVDADVAAAGALIASDFELINPLGEVLTRDDVLGGVGSGALDFLADTVTSKINVRLHGNTAVLRYQHTIDIAVVPVGHLTHPAWTTAFYEKRKGKWQIVWEQTGAIGPLPLPS
jgi:hypothetical protein